MRVVAGDALLNTLIPIHIFDGFVFIPTLYGHLGDQGEYSSDSLIIAQLKIAISNIHKLLRMYSLDAALLHSWRVL